MLKKMIPCLFGFSRHPIFYLAALSREAPGASKKDMAQEKASLCAISAPAWWGHPNPALGNQGLVWEVQHSLGPVFWMWRSLWRV